MGEIIKTVNTRTYPPFGNRSYNTRSRGYSQLSPLQPPRYNRHQRWPIGYGREITY